MEYAIQNITNGNITINEAGVASIPCGITTGIVGNTYPQFVAGDTYAVSVADYANKTVSEVSAEVSAGCAAYIATKYPNT